ncbi:MAG: PEP/pyruvate-binding domain-containing protein, partial [Kofleriaceae bacterium]
MHDDDDHSASSRDEPGEPGEPGEAVTGDLWDLRDVRDLRDLRDQGAGFGNKAAGLARLIAAGLPVPPGFAIAARVFEQIAGPLELRDLDVAGRVLDAAARRIEQAEPSTELATELRTSLRELGSVVIVRSSSPLEDGARGGGAGVFESSGPIPAELDRVWHAIRAVWTSALAPVAIAYARGRTQALRLGVIVQHHVAGERVTVYTRAPSGSSDELVIQRGDTLVRVPRARLPERLADHHAAIQALRAERVVGGPVDVELVQQRTPEQVSTQVSTQVPTQVFETWIVQARPIVIAPRRAALTPPPPIVLAPLQDGRVWTWDVTHNPDPLSPAQLALVERVERARLGAYELRAVAGYLYTSPRDPARPTFQGELSAALIARCRELEATADHLLAAASPHRELARAVAAYAAFYALWADELSPRIAELRRRGHAGPGASPAHHRPSSVEAAITACALGAIDLAELVRRIGAVSPAWDVAVATFGERPELLHQAVALAVVAERAERAERADAPRTRGELSTADRARPHELVDLATADRARPHELDDLATADRARPHEL